MKSILKLQLANEDSRTFFLFLRQEINKSMSIDFRTRVEIPSGMPSICYADRMLMLGSCFAENIGNLFAGYKFCVDINPFGILYNPSSISGALWRLLEGKNFQRADLFYFQNSWHSFMHHGSFSAGTVEEALEKMNRRFEKACREIVSLDWLMLTWGTSYVYKLKESGMIVSNCHKLPENHFERSHLSVENVVETYIPLIRALKERNPRLKCLLTVSPIRHVREGLHANQLSKATLLLAAECLQQSFPESVFYFPSYEIVVDELRDYRFYADDMVHPSSLAVSYLWECFSRAFFGNDTLRVLAEVGTIQRDLSHKPFFPESEAYKNFLGQIVLKIKQLSEKYTYLDFQNELELCRMRLKK